ncbi:MAG: DNA gyrase subunit A [Candidatus Borkfalkiaceae bacterium]|nr:DNA gyrase subunit A [Christensenellaceae bacterium]
MSKKELDSALTDEFRKTLEQTNIINVEVDNELKKSFIAYAMAVNVSRAIPDVRDGLKPVHRRILYAMNEMGLTPDKAYKKCAAIVGDVLGKYHPHGDSSVYDALVRLAQDFSINLPLVDGHGNFGSVDGDPPAAYRYTEARMSKLALEMLRDIDKETVDFYPNFDDTRMQPTVLPAKYPNLLVNGSDGIAVGMATNIPPHNLNEVIDATVALIENPEITIDELMQYVPAPDYPTGALLMGRSGVKNAYRTGRGSVILRSRCEIEEFANGTRSRIVVSELPYQVNKQKLIEYIVELVKQKRLDGIADINDESDRHGMRIVIDIKKDANPQVVLNMLYKHTDLQVSNGIILLALLDGEPKVLNLKQILQAYIKHQIEVVTRKTKYDLAKTEEREHLVKGLVIALASIDEVIDLIKKSRDRQEAQAKLMASFELDEKQANAILDMRLQRLTSLEVEKLKEELAELDAIMADLRDILAKPERVLAIVKNDLLDVKNRYPSPRKTELSYDESDIDIADLVKEEDVVISMTHFGYIKRISLEEYKSQRRGGKGVTAHKPKEEDFVENMFVASTHARLLFFTNFGKVYRLMGYEIPEAQKTARGRAVVNLLQLGEGERVSAVIPLNESAEAVKKREAERLAKAGDDGAEVGVSADTAAEELVEAETDESKKFVILATKRGLIKKTAASEFDNIRKTGKIAVNLNEGDELISAQVTSGNDEIIAASHAGKCIRFAETDVRATGRDTQGVKCMEIDDDDSVVDMIAVKEGYDILTVSEHGFGKRTDVNEYRLQSRGGKGVKAGVFNEKTGSLVCMKLVKEDEDVMLIADSGIIIRTRANEISLIGRDTKGVTIMRLENGVVATVAVVPHSEEEPEEGDENAETSGIENGEAVAVESATETSESAESSETGSGEEN